MPAMGLVLSSLPGVLEALDEDHTAHALPADALAQPADAILPRSGRKVRPLRDVPSLRETTLAVGCDPALALLAAHAGQDRGVRMVWLQASSTAALNALAIKAGNIKLHRWLLTFATTSAPGQPSAMFTDAGVRE